MIRRTFLLSLLLTMAVCLSFTSESWAGNALFLPGDAFFSVAFDDVVATQLRKSQKLRVRYSTLNRPLMKCGYKGARWLHVKLPPKMQTELSKLYAILKKQTKKDALKKQRVLGKPGYKRFPGFASFIYSHSFAMRRHFPGIRYNERWRRYMGKKTHQPLLSILKKRWRKQMNYARKVRGLRAKENKKDSDIAIAKEPIAWFILASPNLQDYLRPNKRAILYRVTHRGAVEIYRFRNGEWRQKKATKARKTPKGTKARAQ